jgi:hypothetical protein
MSEIEQALSAAAQPHLRHGEQMMYGGVASWIVPFAARVVPLGAALYSGHFLVVVTGERMIFFPTSIGLLGGVSPPKGLPTAIELSDVARIEPVRAMIIGHEGVRITMQTGLRYDLMHAASVRNVPTQGNFAVGYLGWVAQRVGKLPQRPASERTLPPLPPRAALGTWVLLVAGGLVTVASLAMALLVVVNGFFEGLAGLIPFLGLGAAMFAGGVYLRRQRAAHLGQQLRPIGETLQANKRRILTVAALVGIPLLLCGLGMGGMLIADHVRRAESAETYRRESEERAARDARETTARLADEARFPGHGAYAPAATRPTALVGAVPSAASSRAPLEAAGFTVTEGFEPGSSWALLATGTGGQSLTVSGFLAESSGDVLRTVRNASSPVFWILEVRGPSADVRQRFLDAVDRSRCDGRSLGACVSEIRGRVTTAAPLSFTVGGDSYTAMAIDGPSRFPPGYTSCPAGCAVGPAGFVCVTATTTITDAREPGRSRDIRRDWITWALATVVR